jgi:hypothetical protein
MVSCFRKRNVGICELSSIVTKSRHTTTRVVYVIGYTKCTQTPKIIPYYHTLTTHDATNPQSPHIHNTQYSLHWHSSPPICARFIHHSRRSAYHAPPGATPWRSDMLPLATTATTGMRRWAAHDSSAVMPARRRRLSSHASDRRRSWSAAPGVRPAVTLAYSAWHDGGGGRASKPAPPPPPSTPLPCAAPSATPQHGGPPGPGRRRRACPRTGMMAPPDGEDFVLHPVVLIIKLKTMSCRRAM